MGIVEERLRDDIPARGAVHIAVGVMGAHGDLC